MKIESNIFGHVGALLVVAIWGTTFVSSKVLLTHGLMPADIFFYRFTMAYTCMCLFCHKRLFSNSLTDELTLMGLGVMGGSLYFLTENMSLIYSTASNVSILVSTTPLLTAFVLAIFYKSERMNSKQVLFSLVAFLGVVLVVLNGQYVLHLNPLGDMLALGAALTWAFYSLFMKRLMGRYPADFITRKVFFYGLLTITPYYFLVSPLQISKDVLFQPLIFGNLLFLGLIASMGGYLLWNWVMAKLGAVRSTNYIYLQTLFTMLFASLILGERITPMAVFGALILIAGMYGMQKKNKL